jgi:excisionase family DNA binding protein
MKAREEVVKLEPFAVKIKTAANMLEVSESTVRKLEKENRLQSILAGGDMRITVASIKALAA